MTTAREALIAAASTEDFFNLLAAGHVYFDMSRSVVGEGDLATGYDPADYARKVKTVRNAILAYAAKHTTNRALATYEHAHRTYDGRVSGDKERRALAAIRDIKARGFGAYGDQEAS